MQSFWVKHLPTGVVCRSFFHISREIFKHALHAPDKARAPINGERDILVNRRTSGVADDPRKSKHIRKRRHSESINRTYSSYSRVYGIVLFFYGLGLLLTPRRQSQWNAHMISSAIIAHCTIPCPYLVSCEYVCKMYKIDDFIVCRPRSRSLLHILISMSFTYIIYLLDGRPTS